MILLLQCETGEMSSCEDHTLVLHSAIGVFKPYEGLIEFDEYCLIKQLNRLRGSVDESQMDDVQKRVFRNLHKIGKKWFVHQHVDLEKEFRGAFKLLSDAYSRVATNNVVGINRLFYLFIVNNYDQATTLTAAVAFAEKNKHDLLNGVKCPAEAILNMLRESGKPFPQFHVT